jgi:hypothetical protein
MGIIPIYREDIPYNCEVELSGRIYTIEINYNLIFDFFTITLIMANEILVQNEKLILNQQLFKDLYIDKDGNIDTRFPTEKLIPRCTNGDINRISFTDLGDTVQLYFYEEGENIE